MRDEPIILLLKGKQIAHQPGLSLVPIRDKSGRKSSRWRKILVPRAKGKDRMTEDLFDSRLSGDLFDASAERELAQRLPVRPIRPSRGKSPGRLSHAEAGQGGFWADEVDTSAQGANLTEGASVGPAPAYEDILDGTGHDNRGMDLRSDLAGNGAEATARPSNTAEQPYQADGIKLSRGEFTQRPATDHLPGDIAGHLKPHGRDSVNLALQQYQAGAKSFLIADGTGAGKTRQSLAVAEALRRQEPDKPILIVTQNTRVIHDAFAKDAETMGVAIRPVESLAEVSGGGIYVTAYTGVGAGNFRAVSSGR